MDNDEEMIDLHCEGGHFVNDLESLSGLRSLEAQDSEIASCMLLREGLGPNSRPLVGEDGGLLGLTEDGGLLGLTEDGGLLGLTEDSPRALVSQPLKQLGTQGSAYSTGKCKISALASFDKFTAASAGEGDPRLILDMHACMHASVFFALFTLLR
jgi:hypothetical protein